MSFVQATDLTRTFDLSDPFIVRAISRTPKRIQQLIKLVFLLKRGPLMHLLGKVAQENLL